MSKVLLEDAADALMGLIRANITGIKLAPDKPPASVNQFPFAAAWPGRGRFTAVTMADSKHVATLILEIHVAGKNLPVAIDAVFPFGDEVRRLLLTTANYTLPDGDGIATVETLLLSDQSGGITWIFGDLEWGDVTTIGWRFEIQLKQIEALT